MIKSFLIITSFSILLFSSQQIVLVVADDFNSSRANLEFYEDTKLLLSTEVMLGTNGLGWGIGEHEFTMKKTEPLKYEGDKKAPAGIFKLSAIFGYNFGKNTKLPYLHTSKNLICVDDSNDNFYNHIIEKRREVKSFEFMKRRDHQYKYGIVVGHNKEGEFRRGSCIFLHILKDVNATTAGCSAMKESDILSIINTLDREKNPLLIQIPKKAAREVLELYPDLSSS
ncbi:MAG: L,D-transpeptidase family protein, partial [Campylobacterota bacterium]|nr:L,D-transpeptidase family protein [Campylobacterota bacterium]